MRPLLLSMFVFVALLAAGALCAQESVVWQVGQFDGNYEEFAIARNHGAYLSTFPRDVTFVAGKDDPAKSWSFIQPGPGDGWAGSRMHPFAVVFNLPTKPKGLYRLQISLVNTHYMFPPAVEIKVNDTKDRIDLPIGASDEALTNAAKGRKHKLDLNIPASLLRKGENEVVLTTVHGSHLLYDALSLTNNPVVSPADSDIQNVNLTPTFRFVRRDGKLKRLALLTAQITSAADTPVAKVAFNGRTRTLRLRPRLFGSVAEDIEIDDLAEPARLEVSVHCGGQTKSASCEIRPERHWKVFVLPTAHVDIGYTDVQENVKLRHNESTSLVLDLCRKYPDFKWNMEVGWAEDIYLSMMPADRKAEFIRRAREGRIGCPAIYGNMLTGLCSHEELIRDLYFTYSTAKEYGIPYDMAVSTDVPTQVWTLPSVLAGSGIRYFAAGLNTVRADSFSRLFNKPFYWQGPDGGSVLTWLAPGYAMASGLGMTDSLEKARGAVDGFIGGFNRPDYPYDAVLAYGAFADNVQIDSRLASVVDEWNKAYAYPNIILCRGPEFFRHIEKNFKDSIPTISGDGGVYWEDGAGSSARETALNRLAKEDLVTAEKLFTLATLCGGSAYPDDELAAVWKDCILYDEHTWGAAGSISDPESEMTRKQWAYKARFAKRGSATAAALKERALDSLAKLVAVDEPSVVVFNPLSWPVSDIVRTTSPDGRPAEFAADVPPMAFKVYPLNKVLAPATAAPIADSALENRFYRVEFDPATGAVKRLFDKELNRELVDASAPYGINQYLYISGVGTAIKDATRNAQTAPVSFSKRVELGRQITTVRAPALEKASLIAEVVLYDDQKRIDFLNTLDKTPTYQKEAGYFVFPLGLNKPLFHVQLPNGVMQPGKNTLAGGCMAWYCAQDFVAASDDSVSVVWTALDSPLLTLCDIDRETAGDWPMPSAMSKWPSPLDNGHIYGYAFNNYWFTNYKASQGGELTFRFSLTSARSYDQAAASRFGQSVRNPLLAKVVTRGLMNDAGKPAVPISASLLAVSPDNVCLQALKRAESGQGIIVRLREVGGKAARATISLQSLRVNGAWKCNLLEEPKSKLGISHSQITVEVPANGLATVLLRLKVSKVSKVPGL
ncbi:MAG: polysaccharide lyase family protein [Armatimonadota bacterium]|nr:polysaccharide lyase family protein [Armatimonadota bacterium]